MIRHPATRRPAFTLLELLLASAIGVLLLAALYFAMDMVLRQADASRDEVEKTDTARAVVNRMTIDLADVFGPLPPLSGGVSNSSSGASSSSSGTGTGSASTGTGTGSTSTGSSSASMGSTSTSSATTGTGSASSSTSDPTDPSQTPLATGANLPFGCGVAGTDKSLTIFVSRVPKGLTDPNADPTVLLPTDLRKVTYYIGSNNKLCRQENPWVTADGVWNSGDADHSNEDADVIADEISDVSFEYFDGTDWQTSWDGTQLNLDQQTLLGPPRAIRATFTINKTDRNGQPVQHTMRHVLVIRAANGLIPVNPPGTTGTTGSTTGSTASTGGM
jgi:prepilin-type N-terminal cleavage/methylation domain-containing protein